MKKEVGMVQFRILEVITLVVGTDKVEPMMSGDTTLNLQVSLLDGGEW